MGEPSVRYLLSYLLYSKLLRTREKERMVPHDSGGAFQGTRIQVGSCVCPAWFLPSDTGHRVPFILRHQVPNV